MTYLRSRPIEISSQKVEELMDLFQSISEKPNGAHLTDDQFIDYVTGDLGEEEMIQIDHHLQMCEDCGARVEHLATNAMGWSGVSVRSRFNELRQRVLSELGRQNTPRSSFLETLALQIRTLLLGTDLTAGIVRAATEEKTNFQQSDQWSCYLDTDKRGNYVLRISSYDSTLEGSRLRLISKNWQQEVTLIRVDQAQVGAKVVLSPKELAKIPLEHDFSVELIRQHPEQD